MVRRPGRLIRLYNVGEAGSEQNTHGSTNTDEVWAGLKAEVDAISPYRAIEACNR